MPKETLKDKLDGKTLDLSLSSLTTIPVNELAVLTRATHLDLSCNILTKLPNDFPSLQHIVYLDLSKNQLTELPQNFGALKKLQHLDLFCNKLTTLPVSIFQIKTLKWLDVKENPLAEPLKSVAGDCLDEDQCKVCAKNVLEFMKQVQAEKERQRQKKLQEERALEAERKAEEERQKNILKEEKKREKERRKKQHEERIAQQKKDEAEKLKENTGLERNDEPETKQSKKISKKTNKGGLSCFGIMCAVFIGLLGVVIGLVFFCSSHEEEQICQQTNALVKPFMKQGHEIINHLIFKANEVYKHFMQKQK